MGLSLEYIAGFVDGEGGFGIYPKSARMTVTNLHLGVLEAIREEAGGGRISRNATGCYELQIGSLAMRRFLPRLLPHLIVKRPMAELMLEYLGPISERGGFGVPKPDENELARRRRLREEARAINDSGGRLAWGHARGV